MADELIKLMISVPGLIEWAEKHEKDINLLKAEIAELKKITGLSNSQQTNIPYFVGQHTVEEHKLNENAYDPTKVLDDFYFPTKTKSTKKPVKKAVKKSVKKTSPQKAKELAVEPVNVKT